MCLFISLLGHSNKVCHATFWHKNTWLTLTPYDCILNATSFPIRPNPIIAKTFPNNSDPMNYDPKWISILRRWGKRNFNAIFHNDWDKHKINFPFFWSLYVHWLFKEEKNALKYQSQMVKTVHFYLWTLAKLCYVSISFLSRVCFDLFCALSQKSYCEVIFLSEICKICNSK